MRTQLKEHGRSSATKHLLGISEPDSSAVFGQRQHVFLHNFNNGLLEGKRLLTNIDIRHEIARLRSRI